MSSTSVVGQERTFGDTTRKVCCWGWSGRISPKSGHRPVNVRSWGRCRRTGDMAGESVVSQKVTLAVHKATAFWHLDAGGGSRPLHQKRTFEALAEIHQPWFAHSS